MDEILINTSTVGNQEQPAIAAFRGTQFVAVWEDREDGNIKGQMLSPSGNKTSGEFVVNFRGPPATRRRMPAIAETMSGFVVAWTERGPVVPYLGPGTVAGWCLARAVRRAVGQGIPVR